MYKRELRLRHCENFGKRRTSDLHQVTALGVYGRARWWDVDDTMASGYADITEGPHHIL